MQTKTSWWCFSPGEHFVCAHFRHTEHCIHSSPGRLSVNDSRHMRQRHSSSFPELDSCSTLFLIFSFFFNVGLTVLLFFRTLAWFCSSCKASFSGVSVKIAARLFRLFVSVFFLGPAFGNGRTTSGENEGKPRDVDGWGLLAFLSARLSSVIFGPTCREFGFWSSLKLPMENQSFKTWTSKAQTKNN